MHYQTYQKQYKLAMEKKKLLYIRNYHAPSSPLTDQVRDTKTLKPIEVVLSHDGTSVTWKLRSRSNWTCLKPSCLGSTEERSKAIPLGCGLVRLK